MILKPSMIDTLLEAGVSDETLASITIGLNLHGGNYHGRWGCRRVNNFGYREPALAEVNLLTIKNNRRVLCETCFSARDGVYLHNQTETQDLSQVGLSAILESYTAIRRITKNVAADNVTATYIAGQQKVLTRVTNKVAKLSDAAPVLAQTARLHERNLRDVVNALSTTPQVTSPKRKAAWDAFCTSYGNPEDNGYVVIAGLSTIEVGKERTKLLRSFSVAAKDERFAVVLPFWAWNAILLTAEPVQTLGSFEIEMLSPPKSATSIDDVVAWCSPALRRWCEGAVPLKMALLSPLQGPAAEAEAQEIVVHKREAERELFGSALG